MPSLSQHSRGHSPHFSPNNTAPKFVSSVTCSNANAEECPSGMCGRWWWVFIKKWGGQELICIASQTGWISASFLQFDKELVFKRIIYCLVICAHMQEAKSSHARVPNRPIGCESSEVSLKWQLGPRRRSNLQLPNISVYCRLCRTQSPVITHFLTEKGWLWVHTGGRLTHLRVFLSSC